MKFPYSPELPCNHGNAGGKNMAPWHSISTLVPPAPHPPPSPPSSVLLLPTPLHHLPLSPSPTHLPTPHLLVLQGSDRKLAVASSSTEERDRASTMSRMPSLQQTQLISSHCLCISLALSLLKIPQLSFPPPFCQSSAAHLHLLSSWPDPQRAPDPYYSQIVSLTVQALIRSSTPTQKSPKLRHTPLKSLKRSFWDLLC